MVSCPFKEIITNRRASENSSKFVKLGSLHAKNPTYLVHQDGSPGLVVMGDDSCSRGCVFESHHCILDGQDIFRIDLL